VLTHEGDLHLLAATKAWYVSGDAIRRIAA
jgi:hypothetical protein